MLCRYYIYYIRYDGICLYTPLPSAYKSCWLCWRSRFCSFAAAAMYKFILYFRLILFRIHSLSCLESLDTGTTQNVRRQCPRRRRYLLYVDVCMCVFMYRRCYILLLWLSLCHKAHTSLQGCQIPILKFKNQITATSNRTCFC